VNASGIADYSRWKRRFSTYVSSVNNRTIEKALNVLCTSGCEPEELLRDLWAYSLYRIDHAHVETSHKKTAAWTRQFRIVARSLHEGALGFSRLRTLDEHGSFLALIDHTVWNGEFEKQLHLTTGLMKFYARHWERHSTLRKLSSNDFLLGFLCEYVKLVTGQCNYKHVALLLEAAWAAHGVEMWWTSEILQARLRRIPPSMKRPATEAACALVARNNTTRETTPKRSRSALAT
jgi:hypothetical protein